MFKMPCAHTYLFKFLLYLFCYVGTCPFVILFLWICRKYSISLFVSFMGSLFVIAESKYSTASFLTIFKKASCSLLFEYKLLVVFVLESALLSLLQFLKARVCIALLSSYSDSIPFALIVIYALLFLLPIVMQLICTTFDSSISSMPSNTFLSLELLKDAFLHLLLFSITTLHLHNLLILVYDLN